jgi:hypothetical protein
MSIAPSIDIRRRELAFRCSGGLEIALYWDAHGDGTSVEVHHTATGETISFPVRPEHALDAFHHPFAHLAAAGDESGPRRHGLR